MLSNSNVMSDVHMASSETGTVQNTVAEWSGTQILPTTIAVSYNQHLERQLGKGNFSWETPSIRLAGGQSVMNLLMANYCWSVQPTVVDSISRQVGLRCIRKVIQECKPIGGIFLRSPSGLACRCLPWLPSIMNCNLWPVCWNKPFPPRVVFDQCFKTASESTLGQLPLLTSKHQGNTDTLSHRLRARESFSAKIARLNTIHPIKSQIFTLQSSSTGAFSPPLFGPTFLGLLTSLQVSTVVGAGECYRVSFVISTIFSVQINDIKYSTDM